MLGSRDEPIIPDARRGAFRQALRMADITLHQFEISPFCDKVRRILRLKDVPFDIREVSALRSTLDVRRINRIGKLPVLEADGRFIADSSEIARFLDERFPDPPLWPADPRERALCHLLEDWADESLYFYEMTMRLQWPANAPRWSREAMRADGRLGEAIGPVLVPRLIAQRTKAQGVGRKPHDLVLRELGRHLDALDALLGDGDWLASSSLTIADVAVAAQVSAIAGAVEGRAALDAHPVTTAWLQRTDAATA